MALHILFFLSGAAALGYQLVWSKMFSTGVGHEMPALLAIVAAFMAGMALGAAAIDKFIPRDVRAGFWLAGMELTIGTWALLVSFFIPHVNESIVRLLGVAPGALKHWLIVFVIPFVTLLPATTAMGATLPAMEKFLSVVAPANASVGRIYAANTFGAVAGTLFAPFVLMPALGFSRSSWVLAFVNVVAGAGAFVIARGNGKFSFKSSARTRATERITPRSQSLFPLRREGSRMIVSLSEARLTSALFLTGLLGIAYETVGVRVLSQVLEGTIFTYAAVLAVFLLGTAGGAAIHHAWLRQRPAIRIMPVLLYGTGMACMTGLPALMFSGWVYGQCRSLGDSIVAVLFAEMVTASSVFLLPSACMGAVFSQLAQTQRAAGGDIGRMLAANTLGAALAPAAVVALLPNIGAKWLLFATASGYFFLSYPLRPPRIWLVAFLITVAGGWSARLQPIRVPPGGRVTEYREGVMASVAVLADTNGHRTLRVDNRYQMGGTAAADAEHRQAHLPLLLHPAPRRALFLGVGTGISFGAASLYPQLEADGVELLPEVVELVPAFAPQNFSPHQLPQLKLHVADARRFVRATRQRYDVIVADVFHPYRDGAGALYTREHFRAIRQALRAQGLFCQWLPLHQLDAGTLRIIVRTFCAEFSRSEAWLLRYNVDVPVVALVGRHDVLPWQTNRVESLLGEVRLGAELRRLALADSLRLHGHWLAGGEELLKFADGAPLNTDDDQRVTFMAPRHAYQRNLKPYASLEALIAVSEESIRSAPELTDLDRLGAFTGRLVRYLTARNVYLRGLVFDAGDRRDEAIDAYIRSARLSPDFTSGYAQCLNIANAIATSDPGRAKRILQRLAEAQPERPVAAEMLRRLFPQ